jgi:hypothetical protein
VVAGVIIRLNVTAVSGETSMSSEAVPDMPYVDRPEVQEVYADQVRLIHFDGYSVRLEFAVVRPRAAGPDRATASVYPTARIVLPPHGAIGLKEQLDQLVAKLEEQGVRRRIAPSTTSRQ